MDQNRLHYPFADAISPFAEKLEVQTRRWLYHNYPMLPKHIKRRYAATRTGYLTARFFPLASYERLLPLAMSSLWGLAFDDYYEHTDTTRFAVLKQQIGSIIRGGRLPENENVFFRQMKKMADCFRKFMPDFWIDRFARSMEIYIDGMAAEAPFKAALKFPSLQEYIDIRWRSVDVLQMIDGLEVATEMPLPDNVRHHPTLEEMMVLTCRIIAWCNDFFSYSKEAGRDVMNLVLVLQHQHHCSLEQAVAKTIVVHDQEIARYQDLKKVLPDFGRYRRAVDKFLEYNELMIAGHWRWYLTDTGRYRAGGSPDPDTFSGNAIAH